MSGRKHWRVMLYSHDSWGLGHLRRSLAIAGALQRCDRHTDTLIVTGSPCATQFELPDRCDVLKLPAVSKDADGKYVPRHLSGKVSDAVLLRGRLISEAYRAFKPHIIIVDHQLTGLLNEALEMLRIARDDGCLLIYGMRDVLDAPDVVEAAWAQPEQQWALKEAYDRICVYGDPSVFDPRTAYPTLDAHRAKIDFSGYIVSPLEMDHRTPVPSLRKRVLVTMGGGEDGDTRIDRYIDALALGPVDWESHIVTGPLMTDRQTRRFKRRIYGLGLADRVRVSRFLPNLPRLLQESDGVVSMAGYNSCAEIMQSGVPAILLPRQAPRKEQLIRAKRFEQLGLADCLVEPDARTLRDTLVEKINRGRARPAYPPLDGLEQVCRLLSAEMSSRVHTPDEALPTLKSAVR